MAAHTPQTAAELLTAAVSRYTDQILRYEPLVLLADHDDDSVHKMRVAVRRIRSLLRTHRPILRKAKIRALDRELKWLAGALGRVRDLEVQCARFNSGLRDLPAGVIAGSRGPAWLIDLRRAEDQARDQLRRELASARYRDLARVLRTLPRKLPFNRKAARPASKQTRELLAKAIRKTRTASDAARGLPAGAERDAALHQARKAAKRLRYTADAAKPKVKEAEKIARRAEHLQEVLGQHHDSVVATGLLTDIARQDSTNRVEAFDLGLLTAAEQCRRQAATRQARKATAAV